MAIAIRELGIADELLVVELLDMFDVGWADALAPGASGPLAFSADSHAFMFGAYDNNDAIGWLWGHHHRSPTGSMHTTIERLDIVHMHRERGIASALLDACVGLARRAGSTAVTIAADQDSTSGELAEVAAHPWVIQADAATPGRLAP